MRRKKFWLSTQGRVLFPIDRKKGKIISIRPTHIAIVLIAQRLSTYVSAQPAVEMHDYLDLGILKERGNSRKMERGYSNWLGFRGRENLENGLAAATYAIGTDMIRAGYDRNQNNDRQKLVAVMFTTCPNVPRCMRIFIGVACRR